MLKHFEWKNTRKIDQIADERTDSWVILSLN